MLLYSLVLWGITGGYKLLYQTKKWSGQKVEPLQPDRVLLESAPAFLAAHILVDYITADVNRGELS